MNYTEKTNEELINEILSLKQDLEKSNRSNEIFRIAFRTSPDSININRLSDGMYVSVSNGFTRILGYSEEEAIGKSSVELNIWSDPENRKDLINALRENGKVENFEAIFRHKNGKLINGLMFAALIDLEGVPHILSLTKDITLRKSAEEALGREQFLINALLNYLPDHVYFKDLESRFIRINKSHALSFGLSSPDQAIGKSDFDFFSKEHAEQAFENEQRIIRTGESISKEEKITRDNMPVKWSYSFKLPLRDNAGNIIGTFGISRDITEQKKSEEQLFLLANSLKSINECVSITDLADKVIFLNKAFMDTYGFNENDLKEESISLIRSSQNPLNVVNEILPATLLGGWHGELWNRKKDGTEFMVSLSTAAIKDIKGQSVALIGVANDITARKRLELENQVNYEIAKGITITSNLDELLKLIHNSLRKIVYAENFFVALIDPVTGLFNFPYFVDKVDSTPLPTSMGKSCSAYVFRTVKPLLLTKEVFNSLVHQNEVVLVGSPSPSWVGIPLQTQSKVIGVMVLQHYDKENVYSEDDVRVLSTIGNQIATAIESKRFENEIFLKNQLLLAINAEKDKFFSIIAHDLRGPLSAFVSATQIIAEEIHSMSVNEIKDITLSMKDSATGIYSLLENLLEWSRLRRGVMDFIPEKIKLKENVDKYLSVLSESARKKKIEIFVSIPDNIEVVVDDHMFDAIIRNLVSNALKFTPQGGNVVVSAHYNNMGLVEISISDTGIGMTPELTNKLFHLCENTSRKGTDGEPSTGLGLLLVKEFVEKHSGKIWAESEVGKGSTFSFTVPADTTITTHNQKAINVR